MNLSTLSEVSPQGIYLRHALEELTTKGSKSLCPDQIAAKSGVESIFQDANELRIALAKIGFIELEERMRDATPHSLPFEERLFRACKSYLTMSMESPALVQLMFGLKEKNKTKAPTDLKEAGDAAFAVLEDVMKDAISQDQLKTNDSRSAALAAWSFIHGFSFLMIRSGKTMESNPEDLLNMYKQLHRLLSKGLMSAKAN